MALRNLKAVPPADPPDALKALFENPEITAMAEICQILQGLEDDAARLRVVRWSFARFGGEEFKRPLANAPAAGGPTGLAPAVEIPEIDSVEVIDEAHLSAADQDFAGQVSELRDLFPRPAALVLNRVGPGRPNSRA